MNQQPNLAILSKTGISEEKSQWQNNFIQLIEILLNRLNHLKLNFILENEQGNFNAIAEKSACTLLLIDNQTIKEGYYSDLLSKVDQKKQWFEKLIAVTVEKIDAEVQAELLLNLVNYDFTDIPAGENEIHQILRLDKPGNETLLKFVDLAYDISKILKLNDINGGQPKQMVYLAEVTRDQVQNRNIIKRELLEYGYEVVPKKSLPSHPDRYKKAVEEFFAQSVIAIHIVGNQYGPSFSEDGASKTEYQHIIAGNYINNNPDSSLARLIWMPTKIKAANEKQDLFIGQLKRDIDSLKNADIIQTPIEEFKSIIKNRIISVNDKRLRGGEKEKEKSSFYLIYEKKDASKTDELAKSIETMGYQVIKSVFDGVDNLVQEHRRNLIKCDGLIIYYSEQNDFWLSSKLKDILKSPGYGRKEPFLLKAVVCDEGVKVNNNYIQDLSVIEGHKNFNKANLETILTKNSINV